MFASWCAQRSAAAIPAPAATVAAFLADEADRGFRPVTIARRAAAIAAAHRAQDHPNPCDFGAVAAVMSGIRRQVGTNQLRRAAPLELEPLELVLAPIDTTTLAGLRDRALLLLGFAAALRRSELVALDVEDLEFDTARGLKLTIRKSKTDQQQAGAQVAVPYARETNRCAVRALSQWLQAANIHRGPVFRRMRRGDTVGEERLTDQSGVRGMLVQKAGLSGACGSARECRWAWKGGSGVRSLRLPNAREGCASPWRSCSRRTFRKLR